MDYTRISEAISNLETNIRWIEDIPAHRFPGWFNVVMAMQEAIEILDEIKAHVDDLK